MRFFIFILVYISTASGVSVAGGDTETPESFINNNRGKYFSGNSDAGLSCSVEVTDQVLRVGETLVDDEGHFHPGYSFVFQLSDLQAVTGQSNEFLAHDNPEAPDDTVIATVGSDGHLTNVRVQKSDAQDAYFQCRNLAEVL